MSTLPALIILAATVLPASTLPAVQPQAPAQEQRLYLPLGEIDAADLAPSLRELLPGLVAAGLESGGAWSVAPVPEGADWKLTLLVSGRGPWRLSARVVSVSAGGHGKSVSTKKYPFSDREGLTGAVDTLISEIDQRLTPAGSAGGAVPLPMARALSGVTKAVDAYLAAMTLVRSGEAVKARAKLDEALAADPSMCLAAVERSFFDLTLGSSADAGAVLAAARAGGACGSPRSEETMRGFELLVRSDPGAAASAEKMMAEPGSRRAGLRLHGLALGMGGHLAESAADWKTVSAADSGDPRAQAWLGSALMASGDFEGAAEAFSRVTAGWPEFLPGWMLRAECQVRLREPESARETLTGMKKLMTSRGLPVDADEHNPDLMLGCIDLMEGRTISALKSFDINLDELEKLGTPFRALDTLHNAIIEMRRNLIEGRDPVTRRRLIREARDAVDRYQSSQPPEHRISHPWELPRLRTLIDVREGNTIDAWKTVEEIKATSGQPGYSEYYEAQLSAAILLKEGDEAASAAQFERAAKASDKVVDLIYVAQMQGNLRKYDDSRKSFQEIARRLDRYDPSGGLDHGRFGELIVLDPHLAAMIPIYHYTWARLGFETNNPVESRTHFNQMLKYLNRPDPDLIPIKKEAEDRGAHPE